ncbi:6009_t:CDS:2 [Entrophospora sp. SA101]|nr:6009_t:CDS:2 [Entrophospora sp. SA101]
MFNFNLTDGQNETIYNNLPYDYELILQGPRGVWQQAISHLFATFSA